MRALITGTPLANEGVYPLHSSGIELHGAIVVGELLNLDGAEIVGKVWLQHIAFTKSLAAEIIAVGALSSEVRVEHDASVIASDAVGATLALKSCQLFRFKAQRMRLSGNLYLDQCLIPNGIDLHNAHIGGQFSCKSVQVGEHRQAVTVGDVVEGHALDCRATHFGGSVYLTPENFIPGEVVADEGGASNWSVFPLFSHSSSARLDVNANTDGRTLTPFQAEGKVDFTRTVILGRFDCRGAKLTATRSHSDDKGRRVALHCDGAVIQASAMIGEGFDAEGEVNFVRARIGADLNATGGRFRNPADLGAALNCGSARVAGGVILDEQVGQRRKVRETKIVGRLVLEHAHCEFYSDGTRTRGLGRTFEGIVAPERGLLVLDGFEYKRLAHSVTDWRKRRDWLLLQEADHLAHNFRLQPWAQLISVLKQVGLESDAKNIAISRERALRSSKLGFLGAVKNDILGFTLGFGYRPSFAVMWSVLFVFLGWLCFDIAAAKGWMVPKSEEIMVDGKWREQCTLPEEYSSMEPLFYAIDVFMPIVEPQLEAEWKPSKESLACSVSKSPPDISLRQWSPALLEELYLNWGFQRAFELGLLEWVRRGLVVLGWIFIPLFLGGVSGVMKKE